MADDVRLTLDEHFLAMCQAGAPRADCTRRQVYCLIVQNRRIVAAGYNGAPPGKPGCLTEGACPRGRLGYDQVPAFSPYNNCIARHAEHNALRHARRGLRPWRTWGATAYITCPPCPDCTRRLRRAGVRRVIYPGSPK